jgi:hypothetical protein
MITNREIASIDRTIYSGYQASWPPPPPAKNKGIFYCGFPAAGTRVPSRNEVVFGAFAGSGVASAVNECDVLTQVEREFLEPALGEGIPPENFDFGGISGGPMLYVVETKSGLRFNALAGIICWPKYFRRSERGHSRVRASRAVRNSFAPTAFSNTNCGSLFAALKSDLQPEGATSG